MVFKLSDISWNPRRKYPPVREPERYFEVIGQPDRYRIIIIPRLFDNFVSPALGGSRLIN